jgi:hypothetical protein
MANQITIDIVAQTQKLTSGINDANSQIDGMSNKLKGAAAAAGAAASAFVLKQGVTFLKQGIDEAKEAQETMRAATTTFGEGSAALAKITADAEKFGKAMAVDNDEIIKLSTQLGSRLPADSKALSAELVNLAFDVEAFTAGALSAETVTGKLAKALADGELKAADLEKIVPGLTKAQYEQAEAASKAGDNQKALTLIIEAAQQKYGDAAEKNVTSTQKFETALANLKESVGAKVLPIVEKFINALTFLIEKFDGLPTPVQNLILGLTGVVAIGGPLLTFLASAKTSLVTLGLVSGTTTTAIGATTIATNLLRVALAGLGIGLVIAAIVLLVQNWDKVTEAVDNVWEKIKDVVPKAWAKVMEFKDKVVGFVGQIVSAYLSIPGKMLDIGEDIVRGLWNGMKNMLGWLTNQVKGLFGGVIDTAKKAFGIKSPSKVFAGIGKNVATGFWTGLKSQERYVKNNLENFFTEVIPTISPEALIPNFSNLATLDDVAGAVSNATTDQSLLAGVGLDWNAGTEQYDIDDTVVTKDFLFGIAGSNFSIPRLNSAGERNNPISITINAGVGTDPYALGRAVSDAVRQYGRVSRNAI